MTRAPDLIMEDVEFGSFRLVGAERLLLKDGNPVVIGGRALDLLMVLVEKAGEVVGRRELMDRVWPNVTVEETNLRVHIAALRKVLGDGQDGGRYITNVSGRGYCFVAAVQRAGKSGGGVPPESPRIEQQTSLPPRLARMVGRNEAVAAVSALLQASRFVTVVGPGGMGKTTVAVAVGHAFRGDFYEAVHFVDLGTVHDQALLETAIASAAGCAAHLQDPLAALITFLGGKRTLLILDSCEHLVDAVATAAERLTATPHVHILATSREALRAEGENVYMISPLEGPHNSEGLTATDALQYPAVQLFMERAAASGLRLQLSDQDAATVSQICRRLDGIPLAIELAASRTGVHGIRGTVALLDNRFRLLWHGRRTALPRHRTLHAMIDWSFNLLSEQEQDTLCRLSAFVGNFTLDGAYALAASEAVSADAASVLGSLVAKSLVWVSHRGEATYYRLLDATRAYAADKLAERGEAGETARRHAAYCVGYVSSVENAPGASGGELLHMDDVRVALAWCFSDAGDAALGIDLAVGAAPLFLRLSLLPECERWAGQAMAALGDTDRGTERELVLLEALAISSMFTRGNGEEIRAALKKGLALAERLGNRRRELQLLAGLNIFATRIGDFRWALAIARRSVEVAEAAGDPLGNTMAAWMVGVSHHLAGDQAEAVLHCKRGFELAAASAITDVQFFGYDHKVRALVALARAQWLRGLPEHAIRTSHQAVDEATARAYPIDVCISYIYTIPVFIWVGDLDRGEERVQRLIAYAGKHFLEPYRAVADALKGELAMCRGDVAAGVQLLQNALTALNADRHAILIATFSRALAEALAKTGRHEQALSTIRGAVAASLDKGGTFDLPDLLRAEGEILMLAPHPDLVRAEEAFARSIAHARKQSALGWELRTAIALARLWASQGRTAEARTLLDDLLRQYTEGLETADLLAARKLSRDLRARQN